MIILISSVNNVLDNNKGEKIDYNEQLTLKRLSKECKLGTREKHSNRTFG